MITIYHNPRCSKSRQTLKLVEESGEEVKTITYLTEPPTADELRDIVDKLGLPVTYIIRKNETIYKDQFKNKEVTDDEWFEILSENPILIERPIVVRGDDAILGRPPENVEKLL